MMTFETLHQQVDLASVAADYTDLAASRDTLQGKCPHPGHEDNTPSFYVYQDGYFHSNPQLSRR